MGTTCVVISDGKDHAEILGSVLLARNNSLIIAQPPARKGVPTNRGLEIDPSSSPTGPSYTYVQAMAHDANPHTHVSRLFVSICVPF